MVYDYIMDLNRIVEDSPLRHLNTSLHPWDALVLWSAFVLGTSGECALVVGERLYNAEKYILHQLGKTP